MPDKLTIGYVTNIYARASDSFIRGEVQQLRSMGHTVHTFSIRRAKEDQNISQEICQEQSTTDYILSHNPLRLLLSFLSGCLRSPLRMFATLRLARQTTAAGLKAKVWQVAYMLEASYLAERAGKLGIQHLHNHIPVGVGTVTMLAARLAELPYSLTIHGFPTFYEMKRWAVPEKIFRSAFTACISSFCRSQCMIWLPASDWPKLKIIHCGLNGTFLAAPSSPLLDDPRLVCVARFSGEKGHHVLLDAVRILVEQRRKVKLVLVGDGPSRPQIELAVKELQLQEHVQLIGWRDAETVREKILNARALVLPSFAEGLPVVIMEAFALKRPVISTYVAGIPELVENGVNGWLVPAGSAEALADAMRQALASSPEKLARMGQAGYERVTQNHDVCKEAQKLAALFRGAIAEKEAEKPVEAVARNASAARC